MVRKKQEPTFLVRSSYRQRRLRDVAWLLPVFGLLLICVPLLWPKDGSGQSGTADATIYLFVVWFLLILIAAGLARIVRPDMGESEDDR